jgi:N-acetylglucosaminyldiphosphoundecaprenol N-acetyl-beta-D-mannosaminyltransferase
VPAILGRLIAGVNDEAFAVLPNKTAVLGITIDNLTMSEAVARIVSMCEGPAQGQVCFLNSHYTNISCVNAEYRSVLEKAELVLADGIGMKLAGKILGREIKQNVNGTDLFPRLCAALAERERSVYLLGSVPGVAESAGRWLVENYPGISLKGCRHGYFQPENEQEVVRTINEAAPDVLLVALGVPAQDIWIRRHLSELNVRVAIGVGGLFDFYSGRVPRAPLWVREMGMEWLYRFYQEPRRLWRRYFIGNGLFLLRVVRERILHGPTAIVREAAEDDNRL